MTTPLHKFFQTCQKFYSSKAVVRQLVFRSFSFPPLKNLGNIAFYMFLNQAGLYKEKALGILIAFNFSSVKSGRTGPGAFDLSTVPSSMEGRLTGDELGLANISSSSADMRRNGFCVRLWLNMVGFAG
mmetsp:Transcript_5223/g.7984  ORF Transcript_5223/g.7984 Transcript_5223/m.7984 type:complete len:128 (+) Transcript_5223:121-504(+)